MGLTQVTDPSVSLTHKLIIKQKSFRDPTNVKAQDTIYTFILLGVGILMAKCIGFKNLKRLSLLNEPTVGDSKTLSSVIIEPINSFHYEVP